MNTYIVSGRAIQKIFSTMAVFAMVFSPLVDMQFANAQAPNDYPNDPDVTICHATRADGNPYGPGSQTVNASSIINGPNGHDDHDGPVWFGGITESWGDIIPPFDYDFGEGRSGSYSGKNWTTEGQAIWNDNCQTEQGTGSITIIKSANGEGGDSTSFEFSIDIEDPNFFVDGDKSDSFTVEDLEADFYIIKEVNIPDGWYFDKVFCSGPDSSDWDTEGDAGVSIDLAEGDDITCTFYNNMERVEESSVTICKYDEFKNLLNGWSVGLVGDTSHSGITGEGENDEGCARLKGVPYGEYTLDERIKEGWYNVSGKGDLVVVNDETEFFTLINAESTNEEPVRECRIGKNLIDNGGFETPVVDTNIANWNIFEDGSTGLEWTVDWFTDNYVGSPDPDNGWLELQRGVKGWLPAGGEQYAELDTDWQGPGGTSGEEASVEISQTVSTDPGARYLLSWDFSPRPDTSIDNNILEVLLDGGLVETNTAAGGGDVDWNGDSYEFLHGDSDLEVMFRDGGIPNSAGTFLDNVMLCKVAEPVPGCTDDTAVNYNPDATVDDQTCIYERPECEIGENLLVNGSFEDDVVTSDKLWDRFASVVGWVVESIVDDGIAGLELHRGWQGNEAADAEQYAELDAHEEDASDSVRVSQEVATEEGATYELRWAFAPRNNTEADQNQLSVLVNDTEVATEGPEAGPSPLTVGDWTLGSYEFDADSDSTKIAFADAGDPQNDQKGTFLDDAILCKIAEAVPGCMDPEANNYNPEATVDDDSCTYGPIVCKIGDNLLSNGSFEEPIVTDHGGAWELFNSITDWVAEKVSDATPSDIELQRGLFGGASDGEQHVELDAHEPSKITQSVVTIPGATYELRFDFSARDRGDASDNNVDATADGSLVVNASSANYDWVTYSDTFVAGDASTDIAFADVTGVANGTGSLIDNAVLCLVQEPEPELETITMCKFDENEDAVSGWGMTLTNGETSHELVTGSDGCVSQDVDPEEGPWEAYEEERSGWNFLETFVVNGEVIDDEGSDYCKFFDDNKSEEMTRLAFTIQEEPAEYLCDFMNEEESGGGGGGGGSSSPRCDAFDLDGDVLSWETRRGNDLNITLNGSEIFTTTDDDEVDEGEHTLSEGAIVGDEFVLTVNRGSRDDTCTIELEGDGEVLGEATEILPIGAPDTGAGGTAAPVMPAVSSLLATLATTVGVRRIKNG